MVEGRRVLGLVLFRRLWADSMRWDEEVLCNARLDLATIHPTLSSSGAAPAPFPLRRQHCLWCSTGCLRQGGSAG